MSNDERARVRAKVLAAAKLAAEAEATKKASATPRERFFAVAVAAQQCATEESHREGDLVDDLIVEIADEAAEPWKPKGF